MNRPNNPRHASEPLPPPEAALSSAERSELQRQGAKAAARGEANDANPLSQPRNQPPATGESADRWLQRSDAWERGHETQSRNRQRAQRPAPKGGNDEHM
jgi:hypothetical protein